MRSALRNSTVVYIVRNSRVAALLMRIRRAVSDDSADAQDAADTEPDEPSGDTTDAATSSGVAAGSLLFAVFARTSAWIRGSWLYRWLTAEPDPDVIVIDLRETRIVGPILRVLDWLFASLGAGSDGSLLAGAARRGYRLVVRRPVQLLSAGLGAGALAFLVLIVATGSESLFLVVAAAVFALGAALGSRVESSWAELRETRPVELLVAAFEPPEPPTRDEEHETDDDR
ncbi:hypothetical protein [Halovenus halobia]|uniref:hypothetical protein n=1 Tax=Halovenus halobia TaxID=3396622 RepID=UPI003F55736D